MTDQDRDKISQKDILLRMMDDVRETRKEITDQKVLLTKHVEASLERDKTMSEIKSNVEKIEIRVGKLENFKVKLIAMWAVVSVLVYLALDTFVRKFFF